MTSAIQVARAAAQTISDAPDGTFTCGRLVATWRVLPDAEAAKMAEVAVVVVPRSVETVTADRGGRHDDVTLTIGVQQRVGRDMDTDVGRLVETTQEIADYLWRRDLSGLPSAKWVRSRIEPIYSPEHLAEHRVYTGVLVVVYRVHGGGR